MFNVQQGIFNRDLKLKNQIPVEYSLLNIEHFSTSRSVNPLRGFTLLEVLVSLSIIAFLYGLIVGFARLANHTALRQQARAELVNWQEALDRWYARFGEYPFPDEEAEAEDGVSVSCFFDFKNNEPYYEELDFDKDESGAVDSDKRRYFDEQTGSTTNRAFRTNSGPPLPDSFSPLLQLSIQDPWGMDYRYRFISEDEYEIWSSGPDSKPGTSDDIRLKP